MVRLAVTVYAIRIAADGLPIQHLPNLRRLGIYVWCYQTDLPDVNSALGKLERLLPWLVERHVTTKLYIRQEANSIVCPEYMERMLNIFNTLNMSGLLRSFVDYSASWSGATLRRMRVRCEQSRLRKMEIFLDQSGDHASFATSLLAHPYIARIRLECRPGPLFHALLYSVRKRLAAEDDGDDICWRFSDHAFHVSKCRNETNSNK